MEMSRLLKVDNKVVRLMKSHVSPEYGYKTVLTNSVFDYVDLWLKSHSGKKYEESSFLWKQAKNFYEASTLLPIDAKPLTAYYCIMNATKADRKSVV